MRQKRHNSYEIWNVLEGGGVKLELLNAILYILLQTQGSFVINLSDSHSGYMYIIYTHYRDCSCINQTGLILKFQSKEVYHYNFMHSIIPARPPAQKMLELNKFKKSFLCFNRRIRYMPTFRFSQTWMEI